MAAIKDPYQWIDFRGPRFLETDWNMGHTIGCGIATMLFFYPGLIYLLVYGFARQIYLARERGVKANHEIAFERTGCHYLISALPLGSHPKLPLDQRILIGLNGTGTVEFYTFGLQTVHTKPANESSFAVRAVEGLSMGTPYTQSWLLSFTELDNGIPLQVEFDTRPYSPHDFVKAINDMRAL